MVTILVVLVVALKDIVMAGMMTGAPEQEAVGAAGSTLSQWGQECPFSNDCFQENQIK